jgi:hypothetical protein
MKLSCLVGWLQLMQNWLRVELCWRVVAEWIVRSGVPGGSGGSHRQFKHLIRPGRVRVAGKPSDERAPGTLRSIEKQSGALLR